MGLRSNGGVLGPRTVPALAASSGVWNLRAQQRSQGAGIWPKQDPYFMNVSLLLLGEADVDSSQYGFTLTKNGNATTSATQYKYGAKSWYFDGTGDYLQVGTNNAFNFGTGDFTVEAWLYIAANSALNASNGRSAIIFAVSSNQNSSFEFTIDGDGSATGIGLSLYTGSASYAVTGTISQTQWHHVCICRSGTSVRFFLNGTQMGSTQTVSASVGDNTRPAVIGGRNYSVNYYHYLNGYIDELRVTKGVARYTANFTPPGTFA